jgi:hypothetical protein
MALGASSSDIHRVNLTLMQFRTELDGFQGAASGSGVLKFTNRDLPKVAQLVADLSDDHPVKQYAHQRGVLKLYPLLYFNHTELKERFKWKDRMVIPFTHNGNLVGWSGRHINPQDKNTPKYLSDQPEGYVFGLDNVHEEHQVTVLVEGALDAILINGISTLGNSISDEQAAQINKLGTTVIVCPDRDLPGKELIEAALKYGWQVSFPPWQPGIKDAGDAVAKYGRLLTVASIIAHSVQNPTKIRVKSQIG